MNILTSTRTLRRGCRNSSAAVVLASMFLLAGAPGQAFADIEPHTGPCIQPASGQPHLNCTANDLALGVFTVSNADGDCKTNPAGHWTLDGYITVPADTTTRYDLGFYIGEDGEQAVTGTCWVDMIEDDPEEPLDIWRDEDGDACGDHPAGEAVAIQVHGVTLKCADADGDAYADGPVCLSYDNNAGVNCSTEADAIPANDAKCQCFTVNTDVRIGCETNADCPADGPAGDEECTTAVCIGSGQPGADILGCIQQNNTEPCDDGVFCNGTDVCAAGVCGHSGDPCQGGGVCEACNEAADNCFVAAGTLCRASAGICDVAENCTGSSTNCPADAFVSSATVCRASAGVCDPAENCTGSTAACPANAFTSSATVCRASAGVCDPAENCTGSAADCPANAFTSSATVCRASAGVCDPAENCTGSAADCPANAFTSSATVCRASAGVCDPAENCTGSAADCPANAFTSSATVCRASAGVCDPAENCTGSTAACPADAFTSSATVCRASAGVCDVAENCTGSTAACPADAMLSSAAICRASAGVCDMTDYCTGSAAACPADAKQPDGTSCDEGLFCTDNECLVGACVTTPHDCSDDDACTEDTCNETADACDYEWICVDDICRSAGYWANHSGYEKAGKSINVAQMLLDEVGPLEVCGQTISATSNASSPYLAGLGLTSDLQGLCMRPKGVQQRQLYRQLTAAALNCAISGHADDCDTVVEKYVDVSFSDCSDLCAGDPPVVDPPTMGECKEQLDCFNNGGRMVLDVGCALGTCAEQPELYCGDDAGPCPDFEAAPQECERFQGNCHSSPLCNEQLEFCPKNTATSSTAACHEAKFDSCTIDSCD